MKSFNAAFLISIAAIIFLFCSICNAQAQKIPKEPFQFVDSITEKTISEVLVIPRYSSHEGFTTMSGEGPEHLINERDYVDKPFIYRSEEAFILKRPKPAGINLLFFAAGKGRWVDGVLIVVPKYRPVWLEELWTTGDKRKVKLTPISDSDWSVILEKKLFL